MPHDREGRASLRDSWLTVNVRHLAALAAVARESSLADAADSIGYVPTTVGRQIAYLERVAGHKLTDRGSRSAALTEQGMVLLRHAQAILGELASARRDIDRASRRAPGSNLGVASLFGDWVSQKLVHGLLPARPMLERGRSERLLAMLEEGTLDAAFVELPIAAGPFSATEIVSDRCVLACPSTADQPEDLPLVDVADCRVTPSLRAELHPPAPRHAVESPASALAFVRAGVASAVVTRSDVEPGPDVRLVPLDDLPPRVVGLAWHRDRDGDAALDDLRTAVRAAVTQE